MCVNVLLDEKCMSFIHVYILFCFGHIAVFGLVGLVLHDVKCSLKGGGHCRNFPLLLL